ncbi:unnamed protein product [Periconia digitata]|uniref:DUF7580 domain-containing protein n=1 Tax=Periconia digitata TaxID=1303443 RepID=A0A9W4XZ41_9PLEO|nr:unnamed protein product [Periconia digitata]
MSGLEVAGVVLGAIPLVISALEHYGDGIRTMKNMRNYAIVFDDYSTQLDASIGIYTNTCYELLGPLNLPDSQMKALLSERRAEAWADKDLQVALKSRLGDNHHRYASLQNKLNKRIVLFCEKLKLGRNGEPPWISGDGTVDEKARKKFFKSFWLKTRGGFNTEKYGSLLADIDRDIEKLSKLTSGAIQLEPIKTEKRNRSQSAYWQNIRDQAQRLFDSLSSRFSPCSCTHPHQANLRLDIRRSQGVDNATRFAFLLTFEKTLPSGLSPPWDWRDIEIECSQPTSVTVGSLQVETPGKKTARFAPAITVSPSSQPPNTRSPSPGLTKIIDSLCRALSVAHQQDGCLGVLEDDTCQHHVYSVTGPGSEALISEATSMNDIINAAQNIVPRQKCMLALTLASSVLQLHDTPWLPRAWETKDIFFLKTHSGSMIPSQFYVSQTFTSASQVAAAAKRRRLVNNETVFALGVALLELAHGAPILSFKEPGDLNEDGKEDSMTEVTIASRLARQLNSYESENYARAVLRCITCTFDTFASDFTDQEFREAFFQAVVVPLQEDYEHATGKKL